MVITYLGKQFFKITHGETTIAFNPINKTADAKVSRFGADIVLSTTNLPEYNGLDTVLYGDRTPFSVTGPGDYEIKGIFIKGGISQAKRGEKTYVNTAYSLELDGITIGFLGPISGDKIPSEVRDALGTPDVLFVPIGGGDTLSPASAHKAAVSFDPKIIIPMEYTNETLTLFLKEGGAEKSEKMEKLTLKRKDLDGRQGDIIVITE